MLSSDGELNTAKQEPLAKKSDRQLWRDLVAFWFLGLCNNLGYVVMLGAAHDIIARFNGGVHKPQHFEGQGTHRHCNIVSTGAILLADIIPMIVFKAVMPFVPFWVNTRTVISIALSAIGFLVVAFATSEGMTILGVVFTSAGCGIGESTLLSYTSRFNRNVLSTWSSGTGGAGLIGSLFYAGLCSLGVSSKNIMLTMLAFPGIECLAFWLILRRPRRSVGNIRTIAMLVEDVQPKLGYREKIILTASLWKYILPLIAVYFFEYFINQGLFELVHFKNIFLEREDQYRWLFVDYQIGVFISRSSVNLIHFRSIWVLSALQFVNLVYFLTEVLYYYTPTIWIPFVVALWEGLLGGGAYVNTFYRMSNDISRPYQEFAFAMTVQADAIGIMLAGFMAMPVHNAICKLPAPERTVF